MIQCICGTESMAPNVRSSAYTPLDFWRARYNELLSKLEPKLDPRDPKIDWYLSIDTDFTTLDGPPSASL